MLPISLRSQRIPKLWVGLVRQIILICMIESLVLSTFVTLAVLPDADEAIYQDQHYCCS